MRTSPPFSRTSRAPAISAKQGDVFTVVVEIDQSKTNDVGDLLLTDLLPSGFEIEEGFVSAPTYLDKSGNRVEFDFGSAEVPTFTQRMDDRFIAHFHTRWTRNDFGMLSYTVRAAYDTEAVVPDAHVEHMYLPEINGRSAVASVNVAPR